MSNILCDIRTECSRLMVWYDRNGITVREWSDDTGDDETGYHVHEGFYTWEQYRTRVRCYLADNGTGKLRSRIIRAALSLMAYWGPDNDSCGTVSSLHEYINGGHVFNC